MAATPRAGAAAHLSGGYGAESAAMLWSGSTLTGWEALGDCVENEEGEVEEVRALYSAG